MGSKQVLQYALGWLKLAEKHYTLSDPTCQVLCRNITIAPVLQFHGSFWNTRAYWPLCGFVLLGWGAFLRRLQLVKQNTQSVCLGASSSKLAFVKMKGNILLPEVRWKVISAREIFFPNVDLCLVSLLQKEFFPKFTGMLCTATRNSRYSVVPKNRS